MLVDVALQWFIAVPLDRVLQITTKGFAILIPIAFSFALMCLTVGLVVHGYVKFNFFPSIDSDFVTASIEMNDSTTFAMTKRVTEDVRLAAISAGQKLQTRLSDRALDVIVGVNVVIGQGVASGGPNGGRPSRGSGLSNVVVQITDPTQREWNAKEFEKIWRDEIGAIASVEKLTVSAELIGAGDPVSIELSLPDGKDIAPLINNLKTKLRNIPGLFAIRDNYSSGRLEYRLALREEARLYDVTLLDLAKQTRAGFFGIEATKVQRGSDNVAVMVRYPSNERDSISDLLNTRISTRDGNQIPLSSVAKIEEGQSPSKIRRRNGRQITTVTADLDVSMNTSAQANRLIATKIIPQLKIKYPKLIVAFGGEQRTQGDAQRALSQALGIALFIIFALLALIFKSYVQPIVVMCAIPLGMIGAITGHFIMGIPLTILSIFGIIGLAGVVINNSLVMVDLYNEHMKVGMSAREAVILGTKQRFRPILLTSLTTFLGVYPLIMETSLQAQFLIPLAVSIGYGVLFGTVITVMTVPAVFISQHLLIQRIKKILSAFRMEGSPKIF